MDLYEGLLTRRSVGKVTEPGPDDAELRRLLAAAAAAPDHGLHRPWRFVVLRGAARESLGEAFADALRARRPDCDEAALAADRAKPLRAPVLVAVISAPVPSPKAPEWEQLASAAAAAQNLLLAAHAGGWGAMWRTGWFVDAPEVRAELGLAESERCVGLVYLGTPAAAPPPRPAVDVDALTSWRDS
ncbi:MAG TPA: nitroreductase family protein [Egibacteraceae bacterium]|nr:nitroreductase family protein [Egibacteraceae bacterium]